MCPFALERVETEALCEVFTFKKFPSMALFKTSYAGNNVFIRGLFTDRVSNLDYIVKTDRKNS